MSFHRDDTSQFSYQPGKAEHLPSCSRPNINHDISETRQILMHPHFLDHLFDFRKDSKSQLRLNKHSVGKLLYPRVSVRHSTTLPDLETGLPSSPSRQKKTKAAAIKRFVHLLP